MIQNLYNTTMDLYSYEQTAKNNLGGVEKAAVLKQGSIPCYETEIDDDEQYIYGKNHVIANRMIFCDLLPNIKSSDKIYIDEIDTWFDIVLIDNANEMDHHLEISCLTIESPEIVIEDDSSESTEEGSTSSSTDYSTSSGSTSSSSSA